MTTTKQQQQQQQQQHHHHQKQQRIYFTDSKVYKVLVYFNTKSYFYLFAVSLHFFKHIHISAYSSVGK